MPLESIRCKDEGDESMTLKALSGIDEAEIALFIPTELGYR
jgi:hypothetical protein